MNATPACPKCGGTLGEGAACPACGQAITRLGEFGDGAAAPAPLPAAPDEDAPRLGLVPRKVHSPWITRAYWIGLYAGACLGWATILYTGILPPTGGASWWLLVGCAGLVIGNFVGFLCLAVTLVIEAIVRTIAIRRDPQLRQVVARARAEARAGPAQEG
jgi:hypothetical protein